MRRLIALASLVSLTVFGTALSGAEPEYQLEITGLTVSRAGQVLVDYELRNTGPRRVCLPVTEHRPAVVAEPFLSRTDAMLLRDGSTQPPAERPMTRPFAELAPGRVLRDRLRFSVFDYRQLLLEPGQAADDPRPWKDQYYVILALPIRTCPLLDLGQDIAFNRGSRGDRVVRSLPSSLFDIARLGRR